MRTIRLKDRLVTFVIGFTVAASALVGCTVEDEQALEATSSAVVDSSAQITSATPMVATVGVAAPAPTLTGYQTPDDIQAKFDGSPEEHRIKVNNDVFILFAYENGFTNWIAPVFIYHIPSITQVLLDYDGNVISDKNVNGAEARAAVDAVLADEKLMAEIARRKSTETFTDTEGYVESYTPIGAQLGYGNEIRPASFVPNTTGDEVEAIVRITVATRHPIRFPGDIELKATVALLVHSDFVVGPDPGGTHVWLVVVKKLDNPVATPTRTTWLDIEMQLNLIISDTDGRVIYEGESEAEILGFESTFPKYYFEGDSTITAAELLILPTHGDAIAIGTTNGELAISIDDGYTWRLVNGESFPRESAAPASNVAITDIQHRENRLYWVSPQGVFMVSLKSGYIRNLGFPVSDDPRQYPVYLSIPSSPRRIDDVYVTAAIDLDQHVLWRKLDTDDKWHKPSFDQPRDTLSELIYPPTSSHIDYSSLALGSSGTVFVLNKESETWERAINETDDTMPFPDFARSRRFFSASTGVPKNMSLYADELQLAEMPFVLSKFDTGCNLRGYGAACPVPVAFSPNFDIDNTIYAMGEVDDEQYRDNPMRSVFVSKDAGETWHRSSLGNFHEITALEVDDGTAGTRVLIAGQNAIHFTEDVSHGWQTRNILNRK